MSSSNNARVDVLEMFDSPRRNVSCCLSTTGSEVDKFVPVRENNMLELPCPLGKGPGVQWVRDGRKSVTTRGDGMLRISRMSQREEAEFTCSLADESFNFFIILQGDW